MSRYCMALLCVFLLGCSASLEHHSLVVIDTHIDIPVNFGLGDADPTTASSMQFDLVKARSGGLDAAFLIVYVAQGPLSGLGYKSAYRAAQDKYTAIERTLAMSDEVQLVRSPDELRRAVGQKKFAVVIGVENAYPLGKDLEHLQEFYDRGARYISLTHFGHNHFADSSVAKGKQVGAVEPYNNGISERGRQLIVRMNKLGIIVDVSHTSKATTLQAVALSKVPIIASHSGVKALSDHPRNLSNEEIQAIAAGGGVIQLVAFDHYMRPISEPEKAKIKLIKASLGFTGKDSYKAASQAQLAQLRKQVQALGSRWPRATVKTLVDHIDYVVRLVGINHAGIASDFGGGGGVNGWDSIDQTAVVTKELRARGYSREDVQKIWSGNLLRVWQVAEDYAAAQP